MRAQLTVSGGPRRRRAIDLTSAPGPAEPPG
jgi:hypothetical protein